MSSNDRRGTRSKSDQETAAYMKKMGIRRTTARCPICHHEAGLPLDNHLRACKGR